MAYRIGDVGMIEEVDSGLALYHKRKPSHPSLRCYPIVKLPKMEGGPLEGRMSKLGLVHSLGLGR